LNFISKFQNCTGEFKCVGTSTAGTATDRIKVVVSSNQKVWQNFVFRKIKSTFQATILGPQNQYATRGETITLRCANNGPIDVQYTWERRNNGLPRNAQSNGDELVIADFQVRRSSEIAPEFLRPDISFENKS